jgi:hypothetical protein
MSPRYGSVPDEPQLTRPRASLAAQPDPVQEAPAPPPAPKPEENLKTMTVAIPSELRTAFKIAVARAGVTMQDAAAEAFRMWLAVQEGQKK